MRKEEDINELIRSADEILYKVKTGEKGHYAFFMKIQLPEHVKQIIHRLQQEGYDAYAVGGCVRDTLFRTQPTGLGHYNFRETAGGEIAVFPIRLIRALHMEPLRLCWIIRGMK